MRYVDLLAAVMFLFSVLANSAVAGETVREWPFHHMATSSETPLTDGWRFAADGADVGLEEGWYEPDHPHREWDPAEVPGVWGVAQEEPLIIAEEKVGWYARTLELPPGTQDEPALVFLGSMFITDAWLDGEYLGDNRGGYTPFLFDISDHLRPGETKQLVVRVDNRLGELGGRSVPKAGTGWNTYGGLTREVFLVTRPERRVEGLRTACEVAGPGGPVRLQVSGEVVNRSGHEYNDKLALTLSAGEEEVGRDEFEVSLPAGGSSGFEVTFDLPQARLWSPDDPFLHELEVEWGNDAGAHIALPVGLRQVSIDGPHFLLNGERLWLQGFGQHEMVPGYGPCPPPGWHEAELERIREFGANHFRTGHYPQHPELYAAADRLGLLVFTEIPVWQLQRPVEGWIETERAWEEWAEPQLSAMIRWYRNFTSVVSWGAANEMGGTPDYDRRAVDFIVEKDPERLPMIVMASTGEMQRLYDLLPMAGRNFHYGWYHSQRVYDGLREGLERNLEHAERANVPIWVAELGGMARRGHFTGGYNVGSTRGDQDETYLDKIVRFGFQYNAVATERVCGVAIWTWSDFVRRGGINRHGIFTYEREPKLAAYTVRNLFAGDLRMYLTEVVEEGTRCEPGGELLVRAFVFNPRLQQTPSGLGVRWRILKGGETVAQGEEPVAEGGSARAIDAGRIQWAVPDDARGMFSLWAELIDAEGEQIHTNAVHVHFVDEDGTVSERPGALFLNVTAGCEPADARAELAGVRLPVYADPGLIIPLRKGDYRLLITCGDEEKEIDVSIDEGEMVEKKVAF